MEKVFSTFLRIVTLIIGLLIELIIILGILNFFQASASWVIALLRLLGIVIAISILNNSRHLSSDKLWVILIVLLPVAGTFGFIVFASGLFSSKTFKALYLETDHAQKYFHKDDAVLKEMKQAMPDLSGDFRYIQNAAGFPLYRNTGFDYYGLGEEGWPVMLEEMKQAKEFIFLEYFIIEEGKMWNAMHDILKEKAKEGLEIRVMYDDMGSLNTLAPGYDRKLEKEGIHCVRFNKLNPFINMIMNHRDHRKIMIIDGKTAFSGGVNLADEYINVKVLHGHWKDNVIRIKGEAVWSYTVLFLTNWNALRKTDEDFEAFRRDPLPGKQDGWIAPYGETPLDDEHVGQDIYMNILNSANEYVYIFTPYLIIDTELENALILAAKRGVDVRLLTPGIPDKKIVWDITRSFYPNLIQGGVKIYE